MLTVFMQVDGRLILPCVAVTALQQLGAAFRRADTTTVTRHLADMIFLEGLPMKLIKSKYLRKFLASHSKWVEDVVLAAYGIKQKPHISIAAYKPLSYNTLRTEWLDDGGRRRCASTCDG
jgi:hypothetical protein